VFSRTLGKKLAAEANDESLGVSFTMPFAELGNNEVPLRHVSLGPLSRVHLDRPVNVLPVACSHWRPSSCADPSEHSSLCGRNIVAPDVLLKPWGPGSHVFERRQGFPEEIANSHRESRPDREQRLGRGLPPLRVLGLVDQFGEVALGNSRLTVEVAKAHVLILHEASNPFTNSVGSGEEFVKIKHKSMVTQMFLVGNGSVPDLTSAFSVQYTYNLGREH
jgi:hypothetical protein